ncbi:antirestriction protein [Asaia spathodeae]|uniref:Antirestriction protein n=1 Tax=Asaia spathodeae TaxID=657016 RepID=A0ABX2P8A6_9PROT|nr:antirestriction protein [Asaia spathodeae]
MINNTVELKKVSEENRMRFTPMLFGPRLYLQGEATVFGMASRFCDEYKGGFWEFIELPDGGGFMYPEMGEETVSISILSNGFRSSAVSPVAVGIICTLFTLSHLSMASPYSTELLSDRYHQLRAFADTHPESEIIFSAID